MAKILVIDPSPSDREILERRLKEARHDVMAIANPFSGLPTLWRNRPDVIVLEEVFPSHPDHTGAEAIADLKKDYPQAKFIIFSEAASKPGFVESDKARGADAVVEKTAHADCFNAVVAEVAELLQGRMIL